ncbi:MAG TPA: phosphatase PAP2 family protein [Gemmatimonadaceae bacterium]|nr:phosphatase PAP2 family protein [Gemmatimonadaceae bacterium]
MLLLLFRLFYPPLVWCHWSSSSGIVALVWATLIGVSTLYTKQHYVVDVIGGIAIAYAAYALFLRGYRRETIADIDRRLAPKRALRAVWLYGAIVAFLWTYRLAVSWMTT